jgi:dsDNA-specific endonuclease/ATPase MutS2
MVSEYFEMEFEEDKEITMDMLREARHRVQDAGMMKPMLCPFFLDEDITVTTRETSPLQEEFKRIVNGLVEDAEEEIIQKRNKPHHFKQLKNKLTKGL